MCWVLLLLVVVTVTVPSVAAASNNNTNGIPEREILNQFFVATEGVQWLSKDHWATSAPLCSWYGVTCNHNDADTTSDAGVTAVRLPSNNVARQLPAQLFQLPYLQILDLSDNPIQDANLVGLGYIDDGTNNDLGAPSPLQTLDLSQCLLTNVEGIHLAAPTLTELHLTKNQLGFFPPGIYDLTNLQKLYINYNPNLAGTLATEIGQLTALQEFYAYSNRLSGTIPTEIGLLDKCKIFSLANNRLTGTIPTQVNNMVNLQVFSLHGGAAAAEDTTDGDGSSSGGTGTTNTVATGGLTGPIPSFAEATFLSKLFLADNQFTGSLPTDFLEHNTNVNDFVLINLRNNQLTGNIPASLRHFASLNIDLVGNALTGNIPEYMCTRNQWMNGLVGLYGCDAILCHAGTYNDRGQQISQDTPCRTCPPGGSDGTGTTSPNILGATSCPALEGTTTGVGGGVATDADGVPLTTDPARILLKLYLQTDGPRWEQTSGWDILDVFLSTSVDMDQIPLDQVDYCHFYGVFCDNQRNVQILTLDNNRLRGTVPSEVFLLPNLLSVDLSFNRIDLDFSRPASEGGGLAILQHATNLERLKLSHTSVTRLDGISYGADTLTGVYLDGIDLEEAIPEEVYALTNLDTLHLEASYVTGQLSTMIGQLSNLKRLNLNENQIGGPLPTTLGLLTSLEYLDLSDNDFTGDLPTELGDMTSLWSLRINGARGGLGGPLLPFDRMPNIRELELAFNTLSGAIPSNFLAGTDRGNQVTVRLTGNILSGNLPESLGTFPTMNLQVEDNIISGIPAALCAQSAWMDGEVGRTLPNPCDAILCPPLTWSPHGKASPTLELVCQDCPGNAYYGETVCETGNAQKSREMEILDELFQATGGRYWNATQTNWMKPGVPICQREGVICGGTTDPNMGVTELRLSNFGLRGMIPTSIYELPKLRRLALSWNPVELNFTGIGAAKGLEVLQLSGTKVDSVAGIEGASEILYEVHLAQAGLEGTFPSELLQARTIRSLFMSDNRITGPIPTEISQLDLDLLKLDGNELTGSIPSSLGTLSRISTLHLQNNKLMGLIPSELGNLANLQDLDLSNQRGDLKLTGPLYPFANNAQLTTVRMAGNFLAGLLPANLLQSTDKSASITVDLSKNLLAGSFPAEYDSFQSLNIDLSGNLISSIPSVLCDNFGWMGGAPAGTTNCDFILCPVQYVSSTGHATQNEPCRQCPNQGDAPFFGSTECEITPDDNERDILVQFYKATGGDDWVYKEDWNTILHVCTWYGIICNGDFSVTEIQLENTGLMNENGDVDILELLSRMKNLRKIDLKGNDLTLSMKGLPADSAIESLRLSSTGLQSLEGIGKVGSLVSFHAVDCGLTGSIPGELFGLQNLRELYLSFNSLNGTISSRIGDLEQLEQL
jgi:Leucine-rich repeat (LRR) protein